MGGRRIVAMKAAPLRSVLRSLFFVLNSSFLVFTAAACDENVPTAPDRSDPVIVTNTFSGTLAKNSAATHSFTASSTGSLTATLTAVGPDAKGTDDLPLVVGFGVGIWNGLLCDVRLAQDRAIQSTVIIGNVNASSPLCVRIFDVGNVVNQVDYTIRVDHP
jgi:hypothetical protein